MKVFHGDFAEKILLSAPGFEPTTFRPGRSLLSPHHHYGLATICHPRSGPFKLPVPWGTLVRSPTSCFDGHPSFPRVCISRKSRRAWLHLQPHATGAAYISNVLRDFLQFNQDPRTSSFVKPVTHIMMMLDWELVILSIASSYFFTLVGLITSRLL